MSISFTCLFLVFHYLSLSRLFPSKSKKIEPIYFSFVLLCCVRVFLKETCVEKNAEKKEMEFPICFSLFMCLWLSISLSTFLLFSFCELLLCSKTVFSVFFYAATITAAAAVFLYLFIKRLCVCACVSFYYLLCVCVRACRSLILFCCSLFFFSFIKNSLIYSQLKRKKPTVILSFFLCACVLIPTRLLCVCVCGFFSVDYRWVSGCLYFIYLCVCMCVVCDYHRHRKKNNQQRKFLFGSNAWKNNRVSFFSFS
jgi:hypothetical protein